MAGKATVARHRLSAMKRRRACAISGWRWRDTRRAMSATIEQTALMAIDSGVVHRLYTMHLTETQSMAACRLAYPRPKL